MATAAMMGVSFTVVITDNRGFGCINRLQMGTGGAEFNNLLDTAIHETPSAIDFAAHAAAMGARAVTVDNPAELAEAFKAAKAADTTNVIVMKVDAYDGWTTEGHTWWEVGTPHVSDRESIREKHAEIEAERAKQRRGV